MAYTYRHLTADERKAIAAEHAQPDEPVVDDSLKEAWERDHYVHSLLAKETTGEERQAHLDAMSTIEAALEANA